MKQEKQKQQSIRRRIRNRVETTLFSLGMVAFFYYAFIKFGPSLGFKGILEPMLSAWIGNVVFSIGGLLLLLFTRK